MMLRTQETLDGEIIVDSFAGGGGASTGIELALGRIVNAAINHDPAAIRMHEANHPHTEHYQASVWDVDPETVCRGRPVALAWFSPDCKHFSKAKGAALVDRKIRGLAWIVLRWAAKVRPRVIILENVEEFQTWGPVRKGKPVKKLAGTTFQKFIGQLRALGYTVEWRELVAADYGAPTTRTRFYMIARSDGRPIVWAAPAYAPRDSADVKAGRKLPYHTAAECIDWSIPCQSIFGRKKPLAENTMRRIARGIQKFVVENPEPFIVPIGYGERDGQAPRVNSIDRPLGTVVTGGKHYLVAPTLIQYHSETGKDVVRGQELDKPIMTVDTSPRYALSVAHIMKNYAGGYTGAGSAADAPLDTVTAKDHNAIVTAHIMTMRNNMDGQPADEPLTTISCSGAHHAEVQAFLVKYFSNGAAKSVDEPLDTVTTKDRFALVTIHGEQYIITDIKMRMLQPRELFNAQGFPRNYVIDHDADGHPYGKSKQVARCGNAVTPPVPAALVRANLPEMCKGASA